MEHGFFYTWEAVGAVQSVLVKMLLRVCTVQHVSGWGILFQGASRSSVQLHVMTGSLLFNACWNRA